MSEVERTSSGEIVAVREPELRPIEMRPVPAPRELEGREIVPVSGEATLAAPRRRRWLLHFCVTIPTTLFGIYIFLFASNVYMSEAQFLVRAPSSTGAFTVAVNQGMLRSSDESQIVEAYMSSRDMMVDIDRKLDLRAIYSRPEADFLSRFPLPFMAGTEERLLRHFKSWATTDLEEATGIMTLRAYAYRSDDAYAVGSAMLTSAEELVNRLNARAYQDRVDYARSVIEKARSEVAKAEANLTAFRNATQTVDLGRESTAALNQIGKMATELAQMEASLKQTMSVTPNHPGIPSLRERIASFKSQIDELKKRVTGESTSMTRDLGEFERLSLERGIAAKGLEAASSYLDKVSQEAQVQHFYLARVSEPNRIQTPEYPRRIMWFLIVFAVGWVAYRVILAVRTLIWDHNG
ncbi:hypothetical protein [Bosea sp. 117]|uniref:hypothetical protein n=1 Tax=Bosea sp. 117 TaxID=1125973 RepID=UPI000493C1D2|nr:hypothetical protein [Bosea sp. 117]